MRPIGEETGRINFSLTGLFFNWVQANVTGEGFDSSTIFKLPNGAKRSPDISWVKQERWEALTDEEREKFPPLCLNFLLELRSRTNDVKTLQAKMEEYIENGAQLGWLIDPRERKVYVYQPNTPVQILDQPNTVSGDPLLFVLPVSKFWK